MVVRFNAGPPAQERRQIHKLNTTTHSHVPPFHVPTIMRLIADAEQQLAAAVDRVLLGVVRVLL